MTFNPNIPQSTDLISQSQGQLLTNMSQLNTIFDVDHVTYNNATAANRGKHDKSTYIETTDPATAVNEVAVYAKDLAAASTLYFRKENNGTVIQMSGQDPIALSGGSTFLPGGIVLKWGIVNAAADGATVTFASAFPTTCFQVLVSIYNNGNATVANDYVSVRNATITAANFVVTCSRRITLATNTVTFSYLAIGN